GTAAATTAAESGTAERTESGTAAKRTAGRRAGSAATAGAGKPGSAATGERRPGKRVRRTAGPTDSRRRSTQQRRGTGHAAVAAAHSGRSGRAASQQVPLPDAAALVRTA